MTENDERIATIVGIIEKLIAEGSNSLSVTDITPRISDHISHTRSIGAAYVYNKSFLTALDQVKLAHNLDTWLITPKGKFPPRYALCGVLEGTASGPDRSQERQNVLERHREPALIGRKKTAREQFCALPPVAQRGIQKSAVERNAVRLMARLSRVDQWKIAAYVHFAREDHENRKLILDRFEQLLNDKGFLESPQQAVQRHFGVREEEAAWQTPQDEIRSFVDELEGKIVDRL